MTVTTTNAPAPREERFPLTPIQSGMWYESTLGGRRGANVEQIVCRLEGVTLDVAQFSAAWGHVQARHEVLRARIEPGSDGGWVHVIEPDAPLPIVREDWSGVAADDVDGALATFLDADRAAGFAATAAPVMRCAVLDVGPLGTIVVWTFHHALLDGRSFSIVLDELFDAVDALAAGRPLPELPPAPRFADHVREVLAADARAAERHFRELLDGVVDATPAPGIGDAVGGGAHHEVEVRVPASVVTRLEERAAAGGATLGTCLLAAWAVLVSRWTDRRDVVVGTTRSGRHTAPGAADMVGCLINTVPVRAQVAPTTTVDELLRALRRQQLDVRPHEHAPLVDVRRWIGLPGEVPLVASTVMFERYVIESHLRRRGGRWARRRVTVHEESGFPLLVAAYLDEDDDGLLLRLEHDTALYAPDTIERIGEHLATLLSSLAAAPGDVSVDDLEMLGESERRRLLDDRNPEIPPPTAPLVPELVRRRAAAAPDRVAVVDVAGGTTRTYAELAAAAHRLGHLLQRRGAGPGSTVALCTSRSTAFVEAVLACFSIGAAYVPVDPTYPQDAVAHMLADSRAQLVLTDGASRGELPVDDVAVLHLDDLGPELADLPTTPPAGPPPRRDEIAYVIYTSGSTGRPKGVAVSHGALAEYLPAVIGAYDLRDVDRALQFASTSFDVSVEEILSTLCAGATLVLRSPAMAESIPTFLAELARHEVTVLNLPTAFWHVLVEHLDVTGDAVPASVRLLVVGGERAAPTALETWNRIAPHVRWVNGYGTTETTITSTVHVHLPGAGVPSDLPIGRPLANTHAYVLGGDGAWLMPDGAVGELWLAGPSLAEGYLGRPELTAARFRPERWRSTGRMYATGDLARWTTEGELVLLGRADRQLKLRGFRIEPGEVEQALERQPGVAQAAVTGRRSGGGDHLVGWVVPTARDAVDPAGLVAALDAVLPPHMVPAAIGVCETFPLTPAGKVDLARLPTPDIAGVARATGAEGLAPDDPLVAELVALYEEVLDRPDIEPTTSFFEAGGHSLAAIRLLGRLERRGHVVSLTALHESPSPSELAGRLQGATPADGDGTPTTDAVFCVPIQKGGSRPPLFGVHVIGINGGFFRPLAAHLGSDQPVLGLSIPRPTPATPTAIPELAEMYRREIDRIHPRGPLALAAVSLGSYVAFELAHQLRDAGREVAVLVLFDAEGPDGRRRAGVWDRCRVHMGLLRDHGASHLVDSGRHVLERLALRRDDVRARLDAALGRAAPESRWDHTFGVANLRAAASYEPRPFGGRILVIRAEHSARFDAPAAAEDGLGWASASAGELEVVTVPGEHLSMLEEPHVERVADAVRAAIGAGTVSPGA